MIGVTIAVALLGCLLALALRPIGALCVYCVILFWYPQPLTLNLGALQFSSGRIVILAVLANILFHPRLLKGFKPNKLDLWVLVFYAMQSICYFLNEDFAVVLQWRGAVFFDLIFPYIAARLIVRTRQDFLGLVKGLVLAGIPLALLGAYESKTGHNPVGFLERYYSWGLAGESGDPNYQRHGFFRASVTMGNYISFGMFFAGIAPLCLALRCAKGWSKPAVWAVFAVLLLGLLSSMSSGPIFAVVVSIAVLAFFPWRRYWPVLAALVFAVLLFVEVFSNRHFYYVLTLFAFSLDTAIYRIELIEEAFGGGMAGHWFTGYGFVGVGPGNDNSKFLWEHKDLTNMYIQILAQTGLMGLVPFLALNFLYYRRLVQAASRAAARAVSKSDLWLIWCLTASLIGWNFGILTVDAMDQIRTLLFMFMGFCANLPEIVRAPAMAAAAVYQPHPMARPRAIECPREAPLC